MGESQRYLILRSLRRSHEVSLGLLVEAAHAMGGGYLQVQTTALNKTATQLSSCFVVLRD